MVLPAFVCGGVAVCVCAPLCVLCDKKQAPRLRAAPRELSLRSQIPSPLSSLPGARLLARLASGKGGRRTKAGGEKGGSKKKHNMLLKRSQGVRAHCAVLHGDVATLSHLLQEGPCTLWVAMGAFREG